MTVEPASSCAPPDGLEEMTTPFGTRDEADFSTWATNPASFSAAFALPSCRPVTRGTSTVPGSSETEADLGALLDLVTRGRVGRQHGAGLGVVLDPVDVADPEAGVAEVVRRLGLGR